MANSSEIVYEGKLKVQNHTHNHHVRPCLLVDTHNHHVHVYHLTPTYHNLHDRDHYLTPTHNKKTTKLTKICPGWNGQEKVEGALRRSLRRTPHCLQSKPGGQLASSHHHQNHNDHQSNHNHHGQVRRPSQSTVAGPSGPGHAAVGELKYREKFLIRLSSSSSSSSSLSKPLLLTFISG